MKKAKKTVIFLILMIAMFAIGNFFEKRGKQNDEKFKVWLATDFHQVTTFRVTTFRISPNVEDPVRVSFEFRVSDPIIEEFFLSLSDIQTYVPQHDTVDAPEHSWRLDVFVKGFDKLIPIKFYIPSRHPNIVVGCVVDGSIEFQSHQLFQWYQKYSHRWLTPAAPPPGAAATPTPP